MTEHNAELDQLAGQAQELFQEVCQSGQDWFYGEPAWLQVLLACRLASGHVLLSGPPGVGKTTLASGFGKWTSGDVKRVQMSPDMMPMDVTGAYGLDRKSGELVLRRGPVFSGCLVTDELNRAPGRVHATLLEAMEEGQVSIEGETHILPKGLFVMATRNPREVSGTFVIPRALLDRFSVELHLGYPEEDKERHLYAAAKTVEPNIQSLPPGLVAQLAAGTNRVFVAPELVSYATACIRSLRANRNVVEGPSPRVGISWITVARGLALTEGRTFVTAQDLHDTAAAVICHRIQVSHTGKGDRAWISSLVRDTIMKQPYLSGPGG